MIIIAFWVYQLQPFWIQMVFFGMTILINWLIGSNSNIPILGYPQMFIQLFGQTHAVCNALEIQFV